MKKKIFFGSAVVVAAALTIVACKRTADQKFDARATAASERIPSCEACDSVGTVTLSGVITTNTQLDCNIVYRIDGKVYVSNNATLTIPEGTVLKGVKKANTAEASALVITKGAKLDARGSQTCPILFTSDQASPAPGDWGGIVLLGKATVNQGTSGTIEGINLPSVPAGVDITYGGSIDNDNSGVLTYVRIEYAGASIATDNELNGLTCGGVGSGTTLDFIEVYKGNDDAFEFFGGTVNASHLLATEPDDDAFDFDFGFKGYIQFAVSVLDSSATYSANPNGIESDNDATGSAATPRTQATISNMTVIGLRDSTVARQKGLLNGALFRRNSSYIVRNSIYMGFPTGVQLQSTGSQADVANFTSNLVHGFVDTTLATSPVPSPLPTWSTTNSFYRSANPNASIKLVAPFDFSGFDFRPATGSPALSGANFTGLPAWFTTTTYRGAFGSSNWLAGWTKTLTDL